MEVIHPDDVVLERESANTEENADWLVRYAKREQWKRILLVTSSYHMKRSRVVWKSSSRRAACRLRSKPCRSFKTPLSRGMADSLSGYRITLFEYLKGVYYRVLVGAVTRSSGYFSS